MNENNINNDINQTNVEPINTEVPVQPVQETTPVQPTEPIMPVEPSSTSTIPVQNVQTTTPVVEETSKKKKSILPALIVIIIILLLLGGAAYYLFVMNTNNPVYKMFVKENTTTTTVEKMSKIEATEKVLALYNKNVDDTLLLYNVCGISAIEELNIESAEYKALELPEGNCNGFYQPVKNYKSLEEVKKHIGGYYTEALTEDVAKKFLVKDNVVYCCVPYTSYPIGNDNLEVDTIEIESDKISATVKYTTGGDEMHELENHEGKIVLEKVNDKWLVSSIK